jgi:hypothetical protein
MKEAFAITLNTMHLLRRLHSVLSGTIEAWASFKASGGDIDYFRSSDAAPICSNAKRSFVAINNSFQRLQGDQTKLVVLQKSCFDYSRTVSRHSFHLHREHPLSNHTKIARTLLESGSQRNGRSQRGHLRIYSLGMIDSSRLLHLVLYLIRN